MHELKRCNSCGETFQGDLSYCLNDGSPLVEVETKVGTVLDGRYRLDSLIGEGGMGDVYRATHIHLDTQFAVKLLKPEFVANQTAIKRFRREAMAAGRINHQNAVRVTDFGVTPDHIVYLVMELVEGQSLRDLIGESGKMNYLRVVNIVRQVCGAVEAAHQSGVIHRDLKPDNILIEAAQGVECVKVLDFGIAKLRETNRTDSFLTQAGMIIGTPQYMSPEQCQGKQLDPRSDVYSIGILMYEMLSGEVPFDGETTLQVVYNQLHLPPRPLTELSPQIPVLLARVVLRALAKEPEKRQSSALELSDELKLAVESIGEGDLLLLPYPQMIRQNRSSEGRIYNELPNDDESDILRTSPFAEQAGAARRETAQIARQDLEKDAFRTQTGPGRPSDVGRKSSPESAGAKSGATTGGARRWLIVIIALALLVPATLAVYYSFRPATPKPAPVTPAVPEGMVYIPGGKFVMGRDDGSSDEGPAHEVEVNPYFLDLHEVTNQEYKKFIDATGRTAPKHWKQNGSYLLAEAGFPVTHVTWDDATSYARWANKRLPTEAEWEYAARGGNREYLYPWGNQWQPGNANIDHKDRTGPVSVGSFDKDVSPFGISDMAGNVSEWVQDFYSEKHGAPPDQRFRVYRGGNFLDPPEKSTTTFRWADFPVAIPDDQILRVGFRCARNIE